jgi:hypothetical protein
VTRRIDDLLADLAEAADAAAEIVQLGKKRWDNYEVVWATLRDDIPRLESAIKRWGPTQD